MYFVTTIDPKDDDMRCVGYFNKFKKAEKSVLNNACDIHETCYNYCVIENIKEGLYQYDYNAIWYQWDDINKEYKKIKGIPEKYKHMIGFAIG